jgi:hypothetical protein
MSLSASERYEAAEEMRRRFALLRVNELYDHGDFSDPPVRLLGQAPLHPPRHLL